MPNQHVVADSARKRSLGDMQDAAVLDVAAFADTNRHDVATDDAIVPHRRLGPDDHIADDARAGSDKDIARHLRHDALKG